MTARILIVDGADPGSDLLHAGLRASFEVAAAQDGRTALELAHAWQPDLILLNTVLPGSDGYDTCRRLKDDPRTLHIPVAMLTRPGEAAERMRGLQSGADDFLTSPFDRVSLLARVRRLVRLKRMLDEWQARGETARALGLAGLSAGEPSVAGARALMIDDCEATGAFAEPALAQDGIALTRAGSETEVLALSAAQQPDLIVIGLPAASADPLGLAGRLRAAEATRAVPMLLIAEPAHRPKILRGFDLGANDWLLRPVDEHELRLRARNQIRRKFYHDRLHADLGQAIELALTDPLTGLYNRRYLLRHLRGLLASPHAHEIAVLMADIDHFKTVNDRFGHAAGDDALKLVAATLRRRTRVFDSVARSGGEEFVVVMPGAAPADAMAAAERLRLAIEATPFQPAAQFGHQLTVSIGIAVTGSDAGSAEALLREADRALYRAKRAGRNRVELARVV